MLGLHSFSHESSRNTEYIKCGDEQMLLPWKNLQKIFDWPRAVYYKLLECVVLQRISPDVEEIVSKDQANFRHGHSTCDQH